MSSESKRSDLINRTLDKLASLTGEDFHGYRSEVWNVVSVALSEWDVIQLEGPHGDCDLCNGLGTIENRFGEERDCGRCRRKRALL